MVKIFKLFLKLTGLDVYSNTLQHPSQPFPSQVSNNLSRLAESGAACRQEIRDSWWKRGHDKRDISVARGPEWCSGGKAER